MGCKLLHDSDITAHRFLGERFGLDQQRFVGLAAGRHRLAADDHHQRHRHRRDPVGLDMDHGRRRAVDQPDQAAELGHPGAGVVPGGAQQQMLGLVAAQHVVDEVGREADLAARLALARMVALDQPADHRHLAERGLEQVRLLDPVDEFAARGCRARTGPWGRGSARARSRRGHNRWRRSPAASARRFSIRRVISMPSDWCAFQPSKL